MDFGTSSYGPRRDPRRRRRRQARRRLLLLVVVIVVIVGVVAALALSRHKGPGAGTLGSIIDVFAAFAASAPRIAANLLRRSRRKEERRLRALAKQPAEVSGAGDEGAAGDARLDYEATRPVLARALRSLRADEREVLLLVAWADLSYEEVGRALAIPVGTVRSRLHRARGHMRTVLEREFPNDPKDPTPEMVVVKEDVRWMTSS